MATGRITKSAVDAVAPGAGDRFLWDDKLAGFGLKVTPAGKRTFVFQYRIGGRGAKVRRYTIGAFPKLTADGARKLAEGLALRVAQGADPQTEKVEAARRSVDLAFAAYAERFIEERLRSAWKASHDDGASLLRRFAVPVLKSKPLQDIRLADIRAVLSPVAGNPATARNLFAVMRLLFRWAVDGGDLEHSPMTDLKPPASPVSRDRVLSDAELVLVWRAADRLGYPFGPLFRLLVLTGARREEIGGLEWLELSRDDAQWSLPAGRAKNGVAATWSLSTMALAELDALAKLAGRDKGWPRRGLVFSTTGKTSVSGFSRAKRRLDKAMVALGAKMDDPPVIAPWRLHDLRRTMATNLQKLGVRFEVTEAVLNHVSGAKSGVAGVYQRHDWAPEKAAALQAWADRLAAMLSPASRSNVVSLAEARA
jgi:integrase